jgi:hypothetical protein
MTMSLTVTDYGLGIFNFLSPSQTIAQSAWTIAGTPSGLEIDATTTVGGSVLLKVVYSGNFSVSSIPSTAKTLADIPFFVKPDASSGVSGQAVYVNGMLAQTLSFSAPLGVSTFEGSTTSLANANATYTGQETFISSSNNWTNDCVFGYTGYATYYENHSAEGAGFNDIVVGGTGGINTAVLPTPYKNFSLSITPVFDAVTRQNDLSGFTLTDNTKAVNTLQVSAVQRLQFSDGVLALDLSPGQNSFKAAMLVATAFGVAKLGTYFPQALSFEDKGQTDAQTCALIVQQGLIDAQIGASTHQAFVDFLYLNATGKAIDSATEAQYVNALQNGTITKASLLSDAVSAVGLGFGNVASQLSLTGLQGTGLFYHPVTS